MKIANKKSSHYTSNLKNFKGSNLEGINENNLYIVYSYGLHFPLYIFDKSIKQWYENIDRYSVTTSKHRTISRPYSNFYYDNIIELDTKQMQKIIRGGN